MDAAGKRDSTLVLFTSEQGSQFPGNKWTCWDTGLHTGLVARWPGKITAGRRTAANVQYADAAGSGAVSSELSFDSIDALFGDLVSGELMATLSGVDDLRQEVFRVRIIDEQGQFTTLFDLAGGRPVPRAALPASSVFRTHRTRAVIPDRRGASVLDRGTLRREETSIYCRQNDRAGHSILPAVAILANCVMTNRHGSF